ncbi:MAG: hypothetical protein JXB48_21550 [Candidatus Latescibacteria bacterium]|nr:hypothetical protein [Candidatus Latescibacterota bacterium]
MNLKKWGCQFDGFYTSPQALMEKPGVYVIWCNEGKSWYVIEAGEAENVKEFVFNLACEEYLPQKCKGTIYYSAAYTPEIEQTERKKIVEMIKKSAQLSD